jgi:hypothetical protein
MYGFAPVGGGGWGVPEERIIHMMQAVLPTRGLLGVIGPALVLLSRGWVRSLRLGGYGLAHRPEGRRSATGVPQEDDDVRWHWGGGKPER